jgi:DNA-binding transcriptional MocR family regulator
LQSDGVKYDNVTVTIWRPRPLQGSDPIYEQIADRIEHDVATGVLLPGSRLPTQRALARTLGITTVTVTRAYQEAARRGLLAATVGRGTVVRGAGLATGVPLTNEVDLITNVIQGGELTVSRELAQRLAGSLATSYGPAVGLERHRAAGAAWLQNKRPDATAARVVVTCGAQQGMFAALAALTRPGDVVLCETVVYSGLRAVADVLRIKLEGLPMDRYGVTVDGLARAVKVRGAKVAYLTPTLQNPTGATLPDKRRRELAALAARLGVTLVEDDVYGFLAPDAPPPISSHDPERHIFLTSLGKSVSASLRIGYALANDELVARMAGIISATTFFASPATAEIAATWIEDGSAGRAAAAKRDTIALRQRVVTRVLGASSRPLSPHLWIELPPRRDADAFAEQARARGVRVAPSTRFAISDDAPNAIRLSVGAPASAAELETGLQVVAALLEKAPRGAEGVML